MSDDIKLHLIQTRLPNNTSKVFPEAVFVGEIRSALNGTMVIGGALLLSDLMYFKRAEDNRLEIMTQAEMENEEIKKRLVIVPRLFIPEPILAASANMVDAIDTKEISLNSDLISYTTEISPGSVYFEAYTGALRALKDPQNPIAQNIEKNMIPDLDKIMEGLYDSRKFAEVFNVPANSMS